MAKVTPPSDGLPLWFRQIGYAVQVPKRQDKEASTKQILNSVSGVCKAGRVLAIMGPSGAGKTSLLDILAGRKPQSMGQLCLGHKVGCGPEDIRRQAAYVQQDDAIMASQTVREALHMAALLTLPRELSRAEKVQKAEEVLRTFSLEGCADTIVGDPVGTIKGISGGERKRCAVAMSVMREPRIIYLDEPTSGLDSHKAYMLVKIIKQLAFMSNATVVCTIHQPSSDIFALFDDLMLLLSGRVVFNGPAEEAVPHFAEAGYSCPQYANPADFFFMHVLVAPDGSAAGNARSEELATAWGRSTLQGDVELEVTTHFKPRQGNSPGSDGTTELPRISTAASLALQCSVLLRRSILDIQRNKMRGRAQVAQSLIFGVLMALIWAPRQGRPERLARPLRCSLLHDGQRHDAEHPGCPHHFCQRARSRAA